ncbi:hypothetical protein H2200_004388 [Cladophialophora chaetospira]|uniref:Uncharacterized protein n=1 Tax=Cladophialophora chaetospira TaxID=386627 RepID=A0AA38XD61_9EURO|nr:hypothetical protein H2200_004388 [Cladophialophora chaetospira]
MLSGTYDPKVYANYTPHPSVASIIAATPTPKGMSSDLLEWFSPTYNMSAIRFYGPYKESNPTPKPSNSSTPNPTTTPGGNGTSHHGHGWVKAVAIAVPIGVVAILVGLVILRYRSVTKAKKRAQATSDAAENRKSWIVPWIWSVDTTAPGKDIGTDSSVTEVEHPHSPPPMTQVSSHPNFSPHELEGGYNRDRWSGSTPVRSPRYEHTNPVEGMDTEVHEVPGSSLNRSDDINYDIRNMALYPPSVVSGGKGYSRTAPTSSISQSLDMDTPASPHSTSAGIARSGFTSNREGEVAQGDGHTSRLSRAVSPVDSRGERPGHERNLSDVSSAPSLPSPGEDHSALQSRPTAARSVSGEEIEGAEDPGNRTI